MTLRFFSYGGGVQSTASLVLAAQGEIDFSTFLFCNVGNDSEHPDTLRYVNDVALPYAAAQGIELVVLSRTHKDGSPHTIYSNLTNAATRRTIIPIRVANGAPGNRACTEEFKLRVISRALRLRGATKATPATLGLGISIDEYQRMHTDDPTYPHIHKTYPLIDLRLSRAGCRTIIERAGLPVPPKSACWFCPFHTIRAWRDLKSATPELFDRAVALERTINQRRSAIGRDTAYLSNTRKPLDIATAGEQADMFDDEDDACESGFCMT